jgi:hypothetical protein
LGDRVLEDALLARVIPSIVLFAAIHYKGLEDGPDFQFALSIGSSSERRNLKDNNKDLTDEEKRRVKWRLLINELGIYGCDEFETLVVEFLELGLFDRSKITFIIDRYAAEKQNIEAREKASQFLFKVFWDHRLHNSHLIQLASDLPAIAGLLDPYLVTELDSALTDIPSGSDIGQAIVNSWIETFRTLKHDRISDENPFNRPLHIAIMTEFAALNAQVQARTTVLDACMYIIENNGWGTMQEVAMKSATATDFELVIRNMDIDQLRRFMRRMIEMCLQRQNYDQHFGGATEQFLEACKAIANDPNSSRLAGLIKRLFSGTVLASEIEMPQIQAAPIST